MTQLLSLLPADGWPRFAADAVWQSTLVALVGLLCIHFIARRPATRALACLVTMLVALVTPLVSANARLANWGLLRPIAVREAFASIEQNPELPAPPIAEASHVMTKAAPWRESLSSASGYAGSKRISTSAFFFPAWCLLSATLLMRLVASAALIRRLVRSATACRNGRVLSLVEAAAQRLKIDAPHVLVSEAVKLPSVLAFGRGVVLLPPDDLPSHTACPNAWGEDDRWYAILCHELGHVRRRDGWNRLAVEVATALMPWQPLLWYLRRQFLRHAEEACDDWAVASGADPIQFAAVLSEFIPTGCPLPLGASIMSTDARHRILRLLALRTAPRPRTTRIQLIAITVVACAAVSGIALAQRSIDEAAGDGKPKRRPSGANQERNVSATPAVTARPMYVLEPPDVVEIDVVKLLPKGALKIEKLDHLEIKATGTLFDHPIRTTFVVDEDGEINLGPKYGRVYVAELTVKEAIRRIEEHLRKTLKEPRVSLSVVERAIEKNVAGLHSIGPDGFVNLGALGHIYIAGMTIDKARQAIEMQLSKEFHEPSVIVKVYTYNSKVYYVIIQGGGAGDNIIRIPITGNETVLDALTQVNGFSKISKMRIWIARPSTDTKGGYEALYVKIDDIMVGAGTETNHRILPGDRLFIQGAEVLEKHPADR